FSSRPIWARTSESCIAGLAGITLTQQRQLTMRALKALATLARESLREAWLSGGENRGRRLGPERAQEWGRAHARRAHAGMGQRPPQAPALCPAALVHRHVGAARGSGGAGHLGRAAARPAAGAGIRQEPRH